MPGYMNQNSTVNRIGGPFDQGLYDESSTQQHNIGEKMVLPDGRSFRYVYSAAAIAAGLVVSQDVSATCVVEVDGKATAAAIGATSVILTDSGTLGSATANQYQGAYLAITDDDGEGIQYRIKSNTAASTNAVTFTLFDGLVVALTTDSDVAITGDLWYNVVGATAGTDYIMSGVTVRALQANYYGWVQTTGIALILADGSIAIGDNLTLSDGVAGAVQLKDAETEPKVGFACFAPDSGGHVQVVLQGLVP
jgi:hypothetical protein